MPLGVAITGPAQVRRDEKVTLRIRVTNNSSAILENIKLVVVMNGGLSDSDGNNSVNQTLPRQLAPGQTFVDTLTVIARETGHATAQVVAATDSTSKSHGYEVDVIGSDEPPRASIFPPPPIPVP
jgi:hypothetical protein